MNITRELRGLGISILGLGFAFAVLFFGDSSPRFLLQPEFLPALVVATGLAAASFTPHEAMHRVTARALNAYAEYRIWKPGVVLAVLSSFLGVVFAAPGGVKMHTKRGERYGYWAPTLDIDQTGVIAVVGPLINVMIAVILAFLAGSYTIMFQGTNLLTVGSNINAFLAVSNLLPFYPMDGYKVLRWNTFIWAVVITLSILLFFL
ncbi:MAG: metalloprotease [Candidatus Nanohaloarchaeota archaeon QJJ-7]|nr:metalloprotease [Candidatus Nanohaloarchaeota archaeon QJJ-7]